MKHRLALLIAVAVAVTLHAQAPDVTHTFEVASIRRSNEPAVGGTARMQPGGNYTVTTLTVASLIGSAYGVPSSRVFGAPGWATTELYDIRAKAPGNPSAEETPLYVRSLLRDRFNLVVHQEMREFPVYELKVARADGRLGGRMRPSPLDCSDPESRKRAAELGAMPCGITFWIDRLHGGGMNPATLASALSSPRMAGRTVIDRSGLSGGYDVELEWSSDPNSDKPSIFTAVQEQLGLKLEPAIAPLAVVVVDRVERPSEN